MQIFVVVSLLVYPVDGLTRYIIKCTSLVMPVHINFLGSPRPHCGWKPPNKAQDMLYPEHQEPNSPMSSTSSTSTPFRCCCTRPGQNKWQTDEHARGNDAAKPFAEPRERFYPFIMRGMSFLYNSCGFSPRPGSTVLCRLDETFWYAPSFVCINVNTN